MLDVGDFSGSPGEEGEAITACVLDGLRLMGYHAVTLGERDLLHGGGFLTEGSERLGEPFLTANVVDLESGELLGEAVRYFRGGGVGWGRRRWGGVTVAVMGVTRDDVSPEVLGRGERPLLVKSPEGEVRRLLPEVRSRADVVILLAHLGKERALALARVVEGIDLVISGHGDRPEAEPREVGEALLVHPPDRGRAVGDLTVLVDPEHGLVEWSGGSEILDADHPDDPQMLELVARCKGEGEAASSGDERAEIAAETSGGAHSPARSFYLGAAACGDCHQEIYLSWSGTRHAHAFATLEREGKEEDLLCCRCHTTGFGRGNGFRNIRWTPEMKDVQCEECHGPGSAHVARVSQGGEEGGEPPPRGELGRAGVHVCRRCHTQDRDPGFDYTRDVERGSHP